MVKILVAFSGGKDSQAALIWAVKKYGKERVEAVFCDTGWEHPVTYEHIKYVTNELDVKLVTLKNGSFQDLCRRMKCFPVATRRACTYTLKVIPMIDYIISHDCDIIAIQGIRAKESASRAAMMAECSYFNEYFTDKKNLYHKTAVLEWCKRHDASVLRPVFRWTAQEVIDYILESGQEVNPLYKRGARRVGCFPCIMSRLSEIKILAKDNEMLQRLIDLEREVDALRDSAPDCFFPPGIIPDRFCKEIGSGYPTVMDVVNYINRNDAQLDMFEPEEGYSCMSVYHGLCG